MEVLVGVDIGGTKTAVVLGRPWNDTLEIIDREVFLTEPGVLSFQACPAAQRALQLESDGHVQGSLPVINLAAGVALSTAFGNDVSPELAFAQAAIGHGKPGDVLLGISTSGNALNVRAAFSVARAVGMKTIGMTGKEGGRLAPLCDILTNVPATRTFEVQELHLPVYHCLCMMVEGHFFP